ncbi:MAG: lysine biosynthesis protein LysX [Planctomycetota bacterium]
MRIGMLFDRVAAEEKLLIKEFENKKIPVDLIDIRKLQLNLADPGDWVSYDVVFDRSVSYSKALATLEVLNGWGIATVNHSSVALCCGNKLSTSVALQKNSVPTPEVTIAYSADSAIEAMERMGYPVVMKPAVGSWGRLLSKINDRDAAETILEHKSTLGSYNHSVFYIQQFVDKKDGFDVRSFVVDGKTICAICRNSEHWITNTARGATTANCEVTDKIAELSEAAASAMGGGLLAIDLFQSKDGDWLVNEVNHSMEFRNSIEPTGVNIPEKMVEYVIAVGERSKRD